MLNQPQGASGATAGTNWLPCAVWRLIAPGTVQDEIHIVHIDNVRPIKTGTDAGTRDWRFGDCRLASSHSWLGQPEQAQKCAVQHGAGQDKQDKCSHDCVSAPFTSPHTGHSARITNRSASSCVIEPNSYMPRLTGIRQLAGRVFHVCVSPLRRRMYGLHLTCRRCQSQSSRFHRRIRAPKRRLFRLPSVLSDICNSRRLCRNRTAH
jgi:hypothetical protein